MSYIQDIVRCMVSDFIGDKVFGTYKVLSDGLHSSLLVGDIILLRYSKAQQEIVFFWTAITPIIPNERDFIDGILLEFDKFGKFTDYTLGELSHHIRSFSVANASFVLRHIPDEIEADTEVLL